MLSMSSRPPFLPHPSIKILLGTTAPGTMQAEYTLEERTSMIPVLWVLGIQRTTYR